MDETKKYIIEFSEDPHTIRLLKLKNGDKYPVTEFKTVTPYTEPDLEQVRKEAYEAGAKSSAVVIADDKAHEAYKLGYENGLNDAWDAVKKLARMDTDTSESITGYFGLHNIMHNLTASEAIEKVRQYEQAKEKDGLRQNIQTIIDQCGYSLDEIAEIVQEMKEAQ